MTEYSKIARGSYVSTAGTSQVIQLPFQPQRISFVNTTAAATPAAGNIINGYWDSSFAQGTAIVQTYATTGTSPTTPYIRTISINSMGISTYSASSSLTLGPPLQVVQAPKTASPTLFQVNNHGLSPGDYVTFEGLFQTPTTGMPQLSGMVFSITYVDTNNFSVLWNTSGSNYTALSGSPSGAYMRKVLFPDLYVPNVNYIYAIAASGNQTQISTTNFHNYVLGQQVVVRIPPSPTGSSGWGSVGITTIPEYVATVTSIVNRNAVIVNIDPSTYSAFSVNIPVNQIHGLTHPQIVPIGDINTGGGIPNTNLVSSINGPTINGAFSNNTSQGFIVGLNILNTSGNLISWDAWDFDIQQNS